MKLHLAIAATLVTLVSVGACSAGTSASDSPMSNTENSSLSVAESGSGYLTPDEALDKVVEATGSLRDVVNSKESLVSGLQEYSDGLGVLAGRLTEDIPGVPPNVTFDASVAAGATAVTMQLVIDCLEDAVSPDECQTFLNAAMEQNRKVGEAFGELVPYSNRTLEEFKSQIAGS